MHRSLRLDGTGADGVAGSARAGRQTGPEWSETHEGTRTSVEFPFSELAELVEQVDRHRKTAVWQRSECLWGGGG